MQKKQKDNDILNACGKYANVRGKQLSFIEHLSSLVNANEFHAEVVVRDQSISVIVFGIEVTAHSRVVKNKHWEFFLEYVFYMNEGESEIEVWRFYIDQNGTLIDGIENKNEICECTDSFVADRICEGVMYNALNSDLFDPA